MFLLLPIVDKYLTDVIYQLTGSVDLGHPVISLISQQNRNANTTTDLGWENWRRGTTSHRKEKEISPPF